MPVFVVVVSSYESKKSLSMHSTVRLIFNGSSVRIDILQKKKQRTRDIEKRKNILQQFKLEGKAAMKKTKEKIKIYGLNCNFSLISSDSKPYTDFECICIMLPKTYKASEIK